MAQDLVILAGTDTLGDSRGYLNDSDEALQTCFSGASEPPAPIRRPYMFWADTTNGILFQRNGANDAWIAKSVLADAWGGALMKSVASQAMTQPFDMGGNAIEGLGTGSGRYGHCPGMVQGTDVFVEQLDNGAKITVRADAPDVARLQKSTQARVKALRKRPRAHPVE